MPQVLSASTPRKRAKSNAGFSLLEVLAALVVTMLLIMSLSPLVTQMLATWFRGGEVVSTVEFKLRGLRVLRDDLIHAVVWSGFGGTQDFLAFRGNETSMSFPSASGLEGDRNGLEMVSIDIANSVDGRALIRRRAAVIGNIHAPFADPVVLFSGPYKYILKYYAGEAATSVWTDPFRPPARVVLTIVDQRNHSSAISIPLPILASIASACFAKINFAGCPAGLHKQKPNQQQADSDMSSQ